MLGISELVGNRLRESGGVRYAGFRVLRGGEEPREHGARTVVEKQPTAVPEHTGSPPRRSFAALGRSSLWRLSALMVFRMAMRRSNYLDTAPKFLIDPARYCIVDNVLEDTFKSELEAHRRTNIEEPNFACSYSFVHQLSRHLSIGKLIAHDKRDVQKIIRDASGGNVANPALSLFSLNACPEVLVNEKSITLRERKEITAKCRIRVTSTFVPDRYTKKSSLCSIVVSSRKCKREGNAADDLAKSSIKLLNEVRESAGNICSHGIEHRTEWMFKDIAFIHDTVYTVLVDAFAIVYPTDIISDSTRVATAAHAPRTCYASHAGGPPRTYGPPIAPQLDDRVSVTLDFRASAGLGLTGDDTDAIQLHSFSTIQSVSLDVQFGPVSFLDGQCVIDIRSAKVSSAE